MTVTPLISASELAALLPGGEVLVVDCRFELSDPGKGERDHQAAHVPGAVYAHLDRDLSDHTRQGQGATGRVVGHHAPPRSPAPT